MDHKLTDKQIENWREVLYEMLGPYAYIMSKEAIQKYRDKLQLEADKLNEQLTKEANT
ncbi:MAG: hypothetical protein Q7R33_04700 [Nitrosarchaeum sp.]|nr:hypothetical protein [Nitrosarchaeum sp.]